MSLPAIQKLCADYKLHFGDGGETEAAYPVFSYDDDPVPSAVRSRLVQQLRQIDKLRNDVQPNGVVHDIVDPSLHCRILSPAEQTVECKKLDKHNEKIALREIDFRSGDDEAVDPYDHESQTGGHNEHETVKAKRGCFQWVPAILKCVPTLDATKPFTWKAELQSPIAGVPEQHFAPQFYHDAETVMTNMLPLLEKVVAVSKSEATELQIVTKVQEYVLPPKSKYTGRWHTEGYTERIVATGVYYLDVSTITSGGDLLFRPPIIPAPGYDSNVNYTRLGSDSVSTDHPFKGDFTNEDDCIPPEGLRLNSLSVLEQTWEEFDGWIDGAMSRKRSLQECEESEFDEDLSNATTTAEMLERLKEKGSKGVDLSKVITKFYDLRSSEEREARDHMQCLGAIRRYTKTLAVRTGSAVAFANTIPHRFNTIRNDSEFVQRRLFINFFVVDPSDQLSHTTANSASSDLVRRVLLQNGITSSSLHLLVCEFCGGYTHGGFLHRKVVRDQARAAMSSGRQHWKTQYFGNAGELEFYPDARYPKNFVDKIGNYGRNYEHSASDSNALGSGL